MEGPQSTKRSHSYGSIDESLLLFSPPSLPSRITSVALICLINTLTCWDRYVTAGVLCPIIAFYGISDATGGLIQTAFIIVYILTLIVTGWLGDHSNRKHLLLLSFTAWFIVSAAASFVPQESFWLFLLLRSLAAIGDATVKVIAPAIFADYFKEKERGYAIMIFFTSIPLGISIGMIIGSIITDSFIDWQWSLRTAPLIGLPVLIASGYLIEEPQRGAMDTEGRKLKDTSHWDDLMGVLSVRTFIFSITGASFMNLYGRSVAWWGATLLLDAMKYRNYDESIYLGISFATLQSFCSIVGIVSGLVGTISGVFLAESWSLGRCLTTGRSRANLLVASIGALIAVPIMIVSLESISISLYAYMGANFVAPTVMGGTFPLMTEAILNVISPSDRAMASALFNLVMSVTGDGPGPWLVGQLSDIFSGGATDPASVFYSLQKSLLILACFSSFGVVFLFLAAWSYPDDVKRREEETRHLLQNDNEAHQSILPLKMVSSGGRVTSLVLLSLINMSTMWDRYSTAGVLRSIEDYYSISDSTAGLLQTFFTVVYILMSILLIYLGDRFSRRFLILLTGWIWLVFVVVSSFIPSNLFIVFLSLRSLSAIADSTIIIIGPTMISDFFIGKARSYALTMFYVFISVGISTGLVVGTILTQIQADWQWSIRVVPFLGLPVMILSTIFLKDPIRGENEEKISHGQSQQTPNFWENIKVILPIKTYWFTTVALVCFNFVNRANGWWQTTLMQNGMAAANGTNAWNGVTLPEMQSVISIASILTGLLIAPAIVYLSGKWRDGLIPFCCSSPRSSPLTASILSAFAVPCTFLFVWGTGHNVYLSTTGAILTGVCNSAVIPLALTTILSVVPPLQRASACALLYLIQSATGDACAPAIIGAISDAIRDGAEDDVSRWNALSTALYFSIGVAAFSSIFMFIASLFLSRESIEVKKREEYEDVN